MDGSRPLRGWPPRGLDLVEVASGRSGVLVRPGKDGHRLPDDGPSSGASSNSSLANLPDRVAAPVVPADGTMSYTVVRMDMIEVTGRFVNGYRAIRRRLAISGVSMRGLPVFLKGTDRHLTATQRASCLTP